MRNLLRRSLLVLVLWCGAHGAVAEPISPDARLLFRVIDSLDVEHRWPAGQHVNWETGIPTGRPETTPGAHTHCSAFVAAAAQRVGIYILHPPEHAWTLLANAQHDWLPAGGATLGWKRISDGLEAQDYANRGWLVVASYRNHRDDESGHIAIVRPSEKDLGALQAEGPQITQAGSNNYRSVALHVGFAGRYQEVSYYAHRVNVEVLNHAASSNLASQHPE